MNYLPSLLVLALGCTTVVDRPPIHYPSPEPGVIHRETAQVGPRPVSVLLLRHADPTPRERAQVEKLGASWLTLLFDHPAPWRLALRPVGADPDSLSTGAFQATTHGLDWIDDGTLLPEDELVGLVAPEALPALDQNPIIDTIVETDLDAFAIPGGMLLVVLVSERDDQSLSETGVAGRILADRDEDQPFSNASLTTINTLAGSTCGPTDVGDRLATLLLYVGGYKVDICEEDAGTRVPASYYDSLHDRVIELTEHPVPGTLSLTVEDPLAPDLVEGTSWVYDQARNRIELTGWYPSSRAAVTVEYVIW